MFKKITTTAIAVAALTCGSQAMAEHYVGGNISAMKMDNGDSFKMAGLYGRLGSEFNEFFSGEIRLGTGIEKDSAFIVDEKNVIHEGKIEIDYFYGAYLRGTIPVTDYIYPYATLGFTNLQLEFKSPTLREQDSSSDISYGLGVDIRLSTNSDFNLEYMNYYDKDDIEIDGFSLGFTYRFY